MPAPGGTATRHLWIVITEPDPASNLCGIVSVTTLRNSKDQTVILRVGDHPFIRHEPTIFYGDAMIVDAQRLESEIAAGLAVRPGPVSSGDAQAGPAGRGCIPVHQAEGTVFSVTRVGDKIRQGNDDLSKWINALPDIK